MPIGMRDKVDHILEPKVQGKNKCISTTIVELQMIDNSGTPNDKSLSKFYSWMAGHLWKEHENKEE